MLTCCLYNYCSFKWSEAQFIGFFTAAQRSCSEASSSSSSSSSSACAADYWSSLITVLTQWYHQCAHLNFINNMSFQMKCSSILSFYPKWIPKRWHSRCCVRVYLLWDLISLSKHFLKMSAKRSVPCFLRRTWAASVISHFAGRQISLCCRQKQMKVKPWLGLLHKNTQKKKKRGEKHAHGHISRCALCPWWRIHFSTIDLHW